MTYQQLADALDFNVTADTIRYALRSRGYHRRVVLRKPPLSDENKRIRLQWAGEHVHWSEEQWMAVLWSDETWVTGESHRKTCVTRLLREELDPDCVIEKERRKRGWMFWACFSADQKRPCLFWEKDWGSINKETYCQHTDLWVHADEPSSRILACVFPRLRQCGIR